jgi:hypothetical protein
LKKVIAERDDAKARLRSLEEQSEKARLREIEEKGQYKAELDKILPELETHRTFRKEYDARIEAKLAESEAKLDEASRKEYDTFISGLTREKRIEWVEARIVAPPVTKDSPANGRPAAKATGAKTLAQMTAEERIELARKEPETFRKMLKT